jgi:hypothetical protein
MDGGKARVARQAARRQVDQRAESIALRHWSAEKEDEF